MTYFSPSRVWKKLNLTARLLIISGVLFSLGGTLLLYTMIEQVTANKQVTLVKTLQDDAQSLAHVVTDAAIIGDYASIEQILGTHVKHADLHRVEWADTHGKIIHADADIGRVQAPAWFTRWINIPGYTTTAIVKAGGHAYGSVLLTLSPASSINFLWHTFKQQALIIVLCTVGFYSIMILFLWSQLRPLHALVKATRQFGEGDFSVRIETASAPEISASISAFNHMADTIQALLASTQEKEAHLRTVMNSVDDAILIMDQQYLIESFNPAATQLFACAPEELLGLHFLSLLSESWPPALNLPQTESLEFEANGLRCDGVLFPIELKVKQMQSQGRQLHLANVRDISKRRQTEALLAQDQERLTANQAETEQELRLAHHIFQTITSDAARKPAPIELWAQPMGLFNGDLFLHEYSPSGELLVILCDFTGHGLGAAIGAIPVAEVFIGMSKKGYGVAEIATEINIKLKRVLPTGHFCAACLISINQAAQGLEIWNGGLPPVLIMDEDRKVMRRVASSKLPLGIASPNEFDARTEIISLQGVLSVFMCSDGLTETRNALDEMLGQTALETMIETAPSTDSWLDGVKSQMLDFMGECALSDDLSLLHIQCDRLYVAPTLELIPETRISSESPQGGWRIELQLSGEMIKNCTPIPLLMSWLASLDFSELQCSHIYTILSELINNAVDHGLLRMESDLKTTPNGFENYYAAREKLLAELNHGMLTIELSQKQLDSGKKVILIAVKDTGEGFDFRQVFSQLKDNNKSFGRGIALVDALSSKVYYEYSGNSVLAEYVA